MKDTKIEAPKPSAAETQYQQMQLGLLQDQSNLYNQMQPYILSGLGLTQEGGGLRPLTEEEQYANMSPQQQMQYDLLQKAYERQMKAYNGELDVSPALENDIQKQQEMLSNKLAQNLGPDWINSTAGQQAMSEFQTKAELLREEARRGAISNQANLYGNFQSGMGGLTSQLASAPGYTSGLVNTLGTAQQPGQYYSGLGLQANTAQAQMNAQQNAGLMSGLGSLAGAGLGAWGAYKFGKG